LFAQIYQKNEHKHSRAIFVKTSLNPFCGQSGDQAWQPFYGQMGNNIMTILRSERRSGMATILRSEGRLCNAVDKNSPGVY
jgi:hypothetical protein